ncbi:MAG: hypothetical protein QOI57_264 [Rubrobacteraceae bacterium]|nr:hypothetical protein [Rubrobacteraceae bacterium]
MSPIEQGQVYSWTEPQSFSAAKFIQGALFKRQPCPYHSPQAVRTREAIHTNIRM